jgi:SAM-dependent methyltransferase
MHQSAMDYGRRFFETYLPLVPESKIKVVEIGSLNVNGSLRDVCPVGVDYTGIDFSEGNGVDIVIDDPYVLPIKDESVDVVVTSSCFEHSEFFWLVFLEIMRILKPSGLLYMNAPSNGYFHRWPVDCWRFYPDSGHAMVRWAQRNGYSALLLESFIGEKSSETIKEGGMWNDFVSVILKNSSEKLFYTNRILKNLKMFSNAYSSDHEGILNLDVLGPDLSLIDVLEKELSESRAELYELQRRFDDVLEKELSESRAELYELQRRFDDVLSSRSWRFTRLFRTLSSYIKKSYPEKFYVK